MRRAKIGPMNGRRGFVAGVGAGLVGVPLFGRGQTRGKVYRIGILETVPPERNVANLAALREGLRELGYVEGKNLIIEYRSADGRAERFPVLAAELTRLKVDVLVARGTPAALAAKGATTAIPVLMATMGAPEGTVATLGRPGGNVTGVTTFSTELIGKRIELLRELVPGLARVGLLHNMGNPVAAREWDETKKAALALGVAAELLDVRSEDDIVRAFERVRSQRLDGLLIGADGLTQMHQQRIVDLVARSRVPASYPSREFVEIGGLIAYAVRYPELYRRFASFIDKILKGAKPAELPFEQPTKFELVINLNTARALAVVVPRSILVRADAVIE
ncbi:MAG: ABC transporter substrate-binding protein [Caldimonas sp.]